MLLRIFMFAVALLSITVFAEPVKTNGDDEQRARLNAEIAAIEAKGGVASPAFERELREWEAMMAALADILPPTRDRDLPANISATLALEPSERSPQQRTELIEFFRAKSKIYAAAAKEIEAKRAQLAKIKSHRFSPRDSK